MAIYVTPQSSNNVYYKKTSFMLIKVITLEKEAHIYLLPHTLEKYSLI